jgi:hypothetical protein
MPGKVGKIVLTTAYIVKFLRRHKEYYACDTVWFPGLIGNKHNKVLHLNHLLGQPCCRPDQYRSCVASSARPSAYPTPLT